MRILSIIVLLLAGFFGHAAYAAPVSIGVLGDSYSDEYSQYPPDRSTAKNWVELLSALRPEAMSFGSFSADWGTPRNGGFEFNWAVTNAETRDVLADQLAGLSAQVQSQQVQAVVIFIGANDFLHLIGWNLNRAALQSTRRTAIANIRTMIETLRANAAEIPIVVATTPAAVDKWPDIRAALQQRLLNTSQLSLLKQTLAAFNSGLRKLKNRYTNLAVAEIDRPITRALQRKIFVFGSMRINTQAPGDNPRRFFLADGDHPGTVGQSIFANAISAALRILLPGPSLARLTAAEVRSEF